MVKQKDKQDAWYNAMQRLVHAITTDIDCAYLARVVSYDSKNHTADIQPLAATSDGAERAQYLDVPVSFTVYAQDELLAALKSEFKIIDKETGSGLVSALPGPSMAAGVVVVVICLDQDSDNYSADGDVYSLASSRQHSANDSIIVGVM
jgi:hypothetical protein